MTGPVESTETGGTTGSASPHPQDGTATAVPAPPVAQERTDGPEDIAEFAARLDVDPDRDGIKG